MKTVIGVIASVVPRWGVSLNIGYLQCKHVVVDIDIFRPEADRLQTWKYHYDVNMSVYLEWDDFFDGKS